MSVTVYVENWAKFPTKTVRAYADEEYPSLELEYFIGDPEYTIENGRAFTLREVPADEEKTPYTSSMSYSSLGMILSNIGVTGKEVESDMIPFEEVSSLIDKLQNKLEEISPKEEVLHPMHSILPSTHDFVLEYNYRDILRVANIALENKLGIFWA